MQKKLGIGTGLFAVVLAVTALVCDRVGSVEPPLRVGMDPLEVQEAMGEYDHGFSNGWRSLDYYNEGPDWLGRRQMVKVVYEGGRVIKWEEETMPRSRPPQLNR